MNQNEMCYYLVIFLTIFFSAILKAQSLEINEIKINKSSTAFEIGTDIVQLYDASSISVGQSNDQAFLMKCDSIGEIIWHRLISSEKASIFKRVIRCSDNSIIAVGSFTLSSPTENVDCFISKYSLNGDSLWHRTFGWEGVDELSDAVLLNNGNIIVLGNSELPEKRAFIACVDNSGDTLWTKSYERMANATGQRIFKLNNGNLLTVVSIVSDFRFDSNYGTWFVELTQTGDILPEGTLCIQNSRLILSDAILVDNKYITGFSTYDGGLTHTNEFLIIDRLTGRIIKDISYTGHIILSSLYADEQKIYTSGRLLPDNDLMTQTTWIKCFDVLGTEMWELTSYNDTKISNITSIKTTPDSSIIGTGWICEDGKGEYKQIIIVNILNNQTNAHPLGLIKNSNNQHLPGSYNYYDLLGRVVKYDCRKISIILQDAHVRGSGEIKLNRNKISEKE